jgi:hypothetical protein
MPWTVARIRHSSAGRVVAAKDTDASEGGVHHATLTVRRTEEVCDSDVCGIHTTGIHGLAAASVLAAGAILFRPFLVNAMLFVIKGRLRICRLFLTR